MCIRATPTTNLLGYAMIMIGNETNIVDRIYEVPSLEKVAANLSAELGRCHGHRTRNWDFDNAIRKEVHSFRCTLVSHSL